ncbi:MAG: T9SS type A sorting domain-containing protein [Paludibacteraceae bacterium]|nr:T9SS type A sorting domain-containing protein [Paludibacteraceae bacterium]
MGLLLGMAMLQPAVAQVEIKIDANADNLPISPYIYGKNGAVSDKDEATSAEEMLRNRESGLRFSRQNNGNNATKYNWRKKLTCHPDWYNNIYGCDWDKSAKTLQEELPNVQGMYAFQLIGKAAKTNAYNFNDWEYNHSQWGEWCSLDLCGGGSADANGKLIQKGDPTLYLEDWPADSTVGIYKHWRDDLGLDMKQFKYWNMDNEFEMWPWTHSDVIEKNTNEVFEMMMQNYFATAKAIRAIDPTVKLTGPVAGSEWTWFTPADNQPTYNGKKYCWLEYFLLRCAEEEKATGIKMLDVIDIHFYPGDKSVADVLQTHRVLWDTDFVYPLANGVKTVNGGWDNNQNKEYIFVRCQEWVKKYFGEDREMTYGISEYNNTETFNATVTALSYASFLGEGARHGMEYFTPWTWKPGMWETLHLFGRYAQSINIGATSSNEKMVSAYSSMNASKDSVTIILVNRQETEEQTVNIQLDNIDIAEGEYETLTLSNLPDEETFVSHKENALKSGKTSLKANSMSLNLPPLSLTAVVLTNGSTAKEDIQDAENEITLSPNPSDGRFTIHHARNIEKVEIIDYMGQKIMETSSSASDEISIDASRLSAGLYLLRLSGKTDSIIKKIQIK